MHYIPKVTIQMIREGSIKSEIKKIGSPSDAANLLRGVMEGFDREHFIILALDTKHQVNAIHTVSIGTLNASLVHPREIFKAAILANAESIILSHNHPSGDPAPSREDIEVTARLQKAGEILGIDILDHIIIGDGYYSFKESGQL